MAAMTTTMAADGADSVHPSLRDSMLRGAAWMLAMRMSVRVIGMVNTMIVARILLPEDFGLIAMAMVVVAFVDALNDMGLDMALIRSREVTVQLYNSAWTLSALVGAANAAVLVLIAPHVAAFYGDARLDGLLCTMAGLPLLNGLANPRVADFRRNLHFSKDFQHQLFSRLMALPATIIAALVLRSYWALVVGMFASSAALIVLGYIMRPFFPRPSFAQCRSLLGFSIWVQVRSIGLVLSSRFDQLFIGKILTPADVGGYRMTQELAEMATVETVLPLGRALLPGYAVLQSSPIRRRNAYLKVVGAHGVLATALGGILYCVSGEFIGIVLGYRWLEYTAVFEMLILAAGVMAVGGAAGPFLVAVGRVRTLAMYSWLQLGFLVVGLIGVNIVAADLIAVASVRVVVTGLTVVLLLRVSASESGASLADLARVLVRPLAAMTVMMLAIAFAGINSDTVLVTLILKVIIGTAAYTLALEVFWLFAGRPDGVEKEINVRVFQLSKLALQR
jgi:lipopolysaccharide exporter